LENNWRPTMSIKPIIFGHYYARKEFRSVWRSLIKAGKMIEVNKKRAKALFL
jgi:hypothetical protein